MSEHPPHTSGDDKRVADDILNDADEIGAEIGQPPYKVYRDFALGRLSGVWKDGHLLRGSKEALRRNHRNRARTGK